MPKYRPDSIFYTNAFLKKLKNKRILAIYHEEENGWSLKFTVLREAVNWDDKFNIHFDVIYKRFNRVLTVKTIHLTDETFRILAHGYGVFDYENRGNKIAH